MKRVYVDMDDVLCDYQEAKAAARAADPEMKYPQSTYGFFANLKPKKGAIAGFHELEKHYEVYILTAPSYLNPLCYTEKRVWVENHLGLDTVLRLIISPNKALLKGDYLIDDLVHPGFEGEHLHFGQARFPDWDAVLKYLIP